MRSNPCRRSCAGSAGRTCPTVAEAAPTQLPKTGSELPLLGLLGALSLLSGLGMKMIRKIA
jgi:LPXTG-motif cell wall-anchored protein